MVIDILFSIIILITAIFGMKKGFIESFTDFLNLVVSICVALLFYVELSYIISKMAGLKIAKSILSEVLNFFLLSNDLLKISSILSILLITPIPRDY